MYVNGMGFRAIERVKGVHHTTVIYRVKQSNNYPMHHKSMKSEVEKADELRNILGI